MAIAGDHVQVLVDGYDLTGDHNRITVNDRYQTLEATTFGMSAQRFILGTRQMALQHEGYLNPEAAAVHPVLKNISVNGVVSVLLGDNDTPNIGDPAYNLLTRQEGYTTKPQMGQVIPFTAGFKNGGARGGWGTILLSPTTTLTDTTTTSTVVHPTPTTNGGAAFLQVLQAAPNDTYSISVEDLVAPNTWQSVADFTLDSSQIGSERIAITANLSRYLRVTATRTGTAGDPVRLMISVVRF